MTKRALCLSTVLVALAGTASAQLIGIKTVPVAQANQFDIFPSNNLGMGGVSIALPDTLLDPFTNPAKGARLDAARFFGSPVVYSISGDAGGGRTLPVAAFSKFGAWYGGVSLALQEVDRSRGPGMGPVPLPGALVEGDVIAPDVLQEGIEERSHGNTYAFATLGRALPGAGLSLGGSVFWAGLSAIDGVDLLYAGSAGIRQAGHALDLRLGLTKEWSGGRSLEAVVLHNRFRMTHDVIYFDWVWDPGTQRQVQRPRLEQNLDYTNTWGLHLEYERPLTTTGWRIGWVATANRMSHPKIPNYEIMSIPRDPGDSYAYNFGIGLSKARGPAKFGMDLIFEPIRSHTWADAAEPVVTELGDTIPAGGMTIENRFHFSNALFRMGVGRDVEFSGGAGRTVGLQLGLVVRSIHYRLAQYDHVQLAGRNQEERWVEWTPTWGLSLRFPDLEIRYHGAVTHGTGRPGVAPSGARLAAFEAGSNIIAAPSGPLTLDEVSVATHQISLSFPLR